jgi:hypothetical protein
MRRKHGESAGARDGRKKCGNRGAIYSCHFLIKSLKTKQAKKIGPTELTRAYHELALTWEDFEELRTFEMSERRSV